MNIDIFIPTFRRSYKLLDYIGHVREVTPLARHIVCIVERDDMDSYHIARGAGAIVVINHRSPSYAGSINSAWECLQPDMFFCGADDLRFNPGWLEEALANVTTADHPFHQDTPVVIGTNDIHNQEVARGEHATHYLVSKGYIEHFGGVIDKSAPVLYEGYDHNWTDREFIGTAKLHGSFLPCLTSVVEHLHFTFGLSQMDDTYQKTRRAVDQDQQLYEQRRPLWNAL